MPSVNCSGSSTHARSRSCSTTCTPTTAWIWRRCSYGVGTRPNRPPNGPRCGVRPDAARGSGGSSEVPGQLDDITDTFDVHEWGRRRAIGRIHDPAPFVVDHVPNSYGFRITAPDGKVLAYSGDTAPCDELVDLATDADLFLCEASWTHAPSERPPHLHLSGIEAGEAATKANGSCWPLPMCRRGRPREAIYDEVRQTFSAASRWSPEGQSFEL